MASVEDRLSFLETRIKDIDNSITSSKERGGGMLSSADWRKRIIIDKDEIKEFENLVLNQKWEEITGGKYNKRFAIDPFCFIKLTPFSYDLAVGNELYSVSKDKIFDINNVKGYPIEPRETIIIKTEEYIALPPYYSATVWPRFNYVRQGIFQSFVKIDPTWCGNLAIAITNNSPLVYTIKSGALFATLIIYELSEKTDIFLTPENKIKYEYIDIINNDILKDLLSIKSKINELQLDKAFEIDTNNKTPRLVIKAARYDNFNRLYSCHSSFYWSSIVDAAKRKAEERKEIGVESYGLRDLKKILSSELKGDKIKEDDIKSKAYYENDLYRIAELYGKPFDVIAKIPSITIDQINTMIHDRIQSEFGNNIMPKTVTLMVSVIGFLSLIVAAIGVLLKFSSINIDLANFINTKTFYLLIFFIILISLCIVYMGREFIHKIKKNDLDKLKDDVSELKKNYKTI